MNPCRILTLFAPICYALSIPAAHAGDGTWTATTTPGNWDDTTQWSDEILADGSTSTAFFTSNITATTTVSLNGTDRTIGNFVFSDNGANGSAWLISGNTLTVGDNDTAVLTPTITTTTNATISSIIAGNDGLTKAGAGSLTLNGSATNTFTGGLNPNAGTLTLDFANLATPTNLISSGNALNLGGGTLSITGKTGAGVTTSQTMGNVTVNSGGGSILINPNNSGAGSTTLALGTLAATAPGSSLLLGKSVTANTGAVIITTATNKDTQDIYGGRGVFANGTANTGYDWATTASGSSPYTLSAYSGYATLPTAGGVSATNYKMTAATSLGGGFPVNSLKLEAPGGDLSLGGNTLTIASGGLLSTGTTARQITGTTGATRLTAGNGSGAYELIVHQYNSGGLTISAVIGDNGANATGLTKAGTGTLTLSGTNAYTGDTTINGGGLTIPGTLGSGAYAGNIAINNGGTLTFTNTSAQSISGVISGNGGLAKNGSSAGTLTLSGANTYAGMTNFGSTIGTIFINTIKNVGGGASSLGAPTTVANGTINIGQGDTLKYTGSGDTTDRVILLAAGTPGTTNLEQSGTGLLKFTGAVTNGGAGAHHLNLQGSTAGTGEISGAIGSISNVSKSGTGLWTLSGTNTYGGTTTVSGGTLLINGTNSGTGAVTVANTATLGGIGSIAGATTVQSGGTLAPGNSAGNLNFDSSVNLQTGSTYAVEISGVTTNDKITASGGLTVDGTIKVTLLGGYSPAANTVFDLADADITGSPTFDFTAAPLAGNLRWNTSSFATDGTIKVEVIVQLLAPTFSLPTGGYVGAQNVTITSDNGSTIRYTTDGTNPKTSATAISGPSPLSGVPIPVNSTNLTLTAYATKSGHADSPLASAAYTTVSTAIWNVDADGNWSDALKWLGGAIPDASDAPVDFHTTPQSANATVTLDDNRTVGSMTFGNDNVIDWSLAATVGSTLTMAGSAPTISVLNNTATVSAPLAGTQGLTKAGDGTLILSGANSYSGGTTINSGTLTIGSGNHAGNIAINSGGTLSSLSATLSGVISGNGSLIKNSGAGTLTLSGANTYTGDTIIEGGTLALSGTLGSGTHAGNIAINGGGTLSFINTSAQTLSGVISGNGGLTKINPSSGTLTLSGANTYTGITNIQSVTGTIVFNSIKNVGEGASSFGAPTTIANGNIFVGNTTTLKYTGTGDTSDRTIGLSAGSAGTTNLEQGGTGQLLFTGGVSSTSNFAKTLNLQGSTAGTGEISGVISNGTNTVSVSKSGLGTWILSGVNGYTGNTTVNGGTLGGTGAAGSNFTVKNTATLSPGTSVGTMDTKALTCESGSTLKFEVNSSSATADKIVAHGAVSLTDTTASFVEAGAGTVAPGTKLVILDYTGQTLTGTFTGLAEGSPVTIGANTYTLAYADASRITLNASAGSGFSAWAAANAPGQTISMDHDKDGVPNGIEYFMGLTGSGFTANPAIGTGGLISWPKGAGYTGVYGNDYVIQTSTDLGIWTDVPSGSVTIDADSIDYILPVGGPSKFGRLKVTGP